MSNMLVSVLIDTYNHERYIEQAIVSVLNQDFPPEQMEILVVDDGSTDRTPEIVRKFEPRVRLIRKANGGQASAFNVGIAETKGEIVAFLDGDDWWAREKLKAVTEAFEKNPTIAAVGHGYFEAMEDSPPEQMLVPDKTLRLDLSTVDAARIADPGRMLLGTSRLAARRKLLEQVGPIATELVFCADTPIYTLGFALGRVLVLEQPLCYYRIHSRNLSARNSEDRSTQNRNFELLAFLLETLPPRLASLGVPQEHIDALFESERLELGRFRLQHEGGGRRKTFKAEMRAFHSTYKSANIGYGIFRGLVAALTVLLSPQRFYALRAWYSKRRNLHRVREAFGAAETIVPPSRFQRRPVNNGKI
jgi:glycosyltransferase involved in cell wall biosynthesis